MKSLLILLLLTTSISAIHSQNYRYLTYSLRSMGHASKALTESKPFNDHQFTSISLRPGLVIGAGIGQHLKNSSSSIQLEFGLSYNRFFYEKTRYLAFRQANFVEKISYQRNYGSYQLELNPSFVHQINRSLFEIRWGVRFALQFYQLGQQDRLQQRFFLESPGTQIGPSLSDEFLIPSAFADWEFTPFGWIEFGTRYSFSNRQNLGLEIFGSLSPAVLGVKGREYSYLFGINLIQKWNRPSKK